jgi:hypothetical protein
MLDDDDAQRTFKVATITLDLLSKLTHAVLLPTCIWDVPGSNFGQDTDYPEILSNQLFTKHATIQHYIV